MTGEYWESMTSQQITDVFGSCADPSEYDMRTIPQQPKREKFMGAIDSSGITLGTNFREVQGKADLRAFIVNASLDGADKDAFLVIGKRQFGVGKSYYLPRSEAWRVREPDQFVLLAHDVATAMYGSPNKHDVRLCGDIILNHIDELVHFPPDDGRLEAEQAMKRAEREELVIKIDGKTLVDAR